MLTTMNGGHFKIIFFMENKIRKQKRKGGIKIIIGVC